MKSIDLKFTINKKNEKNKLNNRKYIFLDKYRISEKLKRFNSDKNSVCLKYIGDVNKEFGVSSKRIKIDLKNKSSVIQELANKSENKDITSRNTQRESNFKNYSKLTRKDSPSPAVKETSDERSLTEDNKSFARSYFRKPSLYVDQVTSTKSLMKVDKIPNFSKAEGSGIKSQKRSVNFRNEVINSTLESQATTGRTSLTRFSLNTSVTKIPHLFKSAEKKNKKSMSELINPDRYNKKKLMVDEYFSSENSFVKSRQAFRNKQFTEQRNVFLHKKLPKKSKIGSGTFFPKIVNL